MMQTFTLLDYMQADKHNPWPLAVQRALLRPVMLAATGELTTEKWLAVAGAFNLMWLAKDEGLLTDEADYLEKAKVQLADPEAAKEFWLPLSNSILAQFAYLLQELPVATFIRLHRKMTQRINKNVKSGRAQQKSDTHIGSRSFKNLGKRPE